jgi:single-stranded-DNA-specific exonuclease
VESARIELAPCQPAKVGLLRSELGVSAVAAQVLVRRGWDDPDRARAYLAGGDEHDFRLLRGIEPIATLVEEHVRAGSPITIHGDYDVDGVCATAVLMRALRALGAQVETYLPDRATDGYGLNAATVARLAERGTRLLITVDCGITAVREVAAARASGIEVVVTDHHAPRAEGLPDAHILHPVICGYPCADLCGTAVAYKLAAAVLARAGSQRATLEHDLDLVALATIADSVPLQGENRALVRRGLPALARTLKPGLRALMACARVDPTRIDERAVSFGLAPRLNAAGRLYRADAALELLTTTDTTRAAQVADELDRANAERRDTETRVLFEAEAQVAALPARPAYVLAGERWHAGVIGIVASRLAERHHRPFVLIALDGDLGKGSARSIEGFDLVGALGACREHLRRYGGHRAAAGLEVDRAALQRFGAAFQGHAGASLSAEDLVPRFRADALAGGQDLGLELAEELRSLAPFGQGNPPVSLLIRAAGITELRTMGQGRHLRFALHADGASMNAVAFGFGGRAALRREISGGAAFDGLFRLEVNEWNGVTEPRLNLIHLQTAATAAQTAAAPAQAIGFEDGVPYPVRDARRDHTLAG